MQSVIIFACFYQSSDRTGNTNDSFCMLCTAGKYCQDYGLALPNGDCYAGYYCPEGQDVPQPTNYACSPGHFCEVGSWNETGCPSGMYQPHWARSNCDICPAGSYCKAFGKFSQESFFIDSFVNFNPFIKNNYLALLNNIYHTCEFYPIQMITLAGNRVNWIREAEFWILFTYTGDYEVLDAPNVTLSGNYTNRYRSYRGVSVPTACPPGSYCPAGTKDAMEYLCLEGTYSNKTSLNNYTQCTPCDPGYYCSGQGNWIRQVFLSFYYMNDEDFFWAKTQNFLWKLCF